MTELFLDIVNLSISAGWLVLAVLVLRLVLKKAPKWIIVLLWGIVAVRLIFPFTIESALSLIPNRETISPDIMMDWTPEISTGIDSVDRVVNPVISTSFAPDPWASANPLQILIPVAANIWLLGVLVMVTYTAVSYISLRVKLRTAVILRTNIFQCEYVRSPFVLGILKPRIYLPYTMDGQNLDHVVAHEQAHISRKDHWWKPLGFLLLSVYWFNPLMWIAYILLCRDIEFACDEKVIAQLRYEQRADYSQALVASSVNRRMIAACPLAFGEVGVKERVKSVLNYKKPAFWIIITALVVCLAVAVCFLTDPHTPGLDDVLSQNGYLVLSQSVQEVTLTVPKANLPDEIYTVEGYEYNEDQVVAFSTDTTTIYLRKVMLSNESPDQLYFAFDISYDVADKGTILSIYSRLPNDQYTFSAGLKSKDLRDNHTAFPNAVHMRGNGPDSQLWFYVSVEACSKAEGALIFDTVFNEIQYEAYKNNRTISLIGNNVSDLDPERITDGILRIEDWDSSDVYVNANNFSLTVDSNFDWVDSQAIRYFFTNAKKTNGAQLRIFPEEEKFFMTESSECAEQKYKYLLRNYLEALKYLPQNAIRQMSPADRYLIELVDKGRPSDYDRLITYSSNGVGELDAWFIHLKLTPLHADGEGYSGEGRGVIDLFYGPSTKSSVGYITQDAPAKYYLTLSVEGVYSIEVTTDHGSGGCVNADGTLFKNGERVYLEALDGVTDLRGIKIIAYDRQGVIMAAFAVPKSEISNPVNIISAYGLFLAPNGVDIDMVDLTALFLNDSVTMVPTDTDLQGIHAGALLLPVDGNTYRFLLTDSNPQGLTADKHLGTFVENAGTQSIVWQVFSVKEYQNLSAVLMVSNSEVSWLCTYYPPGRCADDALEHAIDSGYVVMEEGIATHGQDTWKNFYEQSQKGVPASVIVAKYQTLDPARCDNSYYETFNQDYPNLNVYHLYYDGEKYTLSYEDYKETYSKTYEYLMKYDTTEFYSKSSKTPEGRYTYVLTHDNQVTWDQLFNGLVSSQMGAYIDHYSIYTERKQ